MNSIKVENDGEITLSNLRFRKESFSVILSSPDLHDCKLEDDFQGDYEAALFDSDSSCQSFESTNLNSNGYNKHFQENAIRTRNLSLHIKNEDPPNDPFETSRMWKRGRSISVDLINSFIKQEEIKQSRPKKVIIVDDPPQYNCYSRDRGLSMDLIASLLENDDTEQVKHSEKYRGPGSLMPKNPLQSDSDEVEVSVTYTGTKRSRPSSPSVPNEKVNPTLMSINLNSNVKRIGIYTVEERKARIARFHEKRKRRVWRKKIKYDCRKKLAESRPRVKGRFVRRGEPGDYYPPSRGIIRKPSPYDILHSSNIHCPPPMYRSSPFFHPSSIRLTG